LCTGVFAFTNMSTATGIGGAWQTHPRRCKNRAWAPEPRRGSPNRDASSTAFRPEARQGRNDASMIADLRQRHLGETFATRRDAERAIRDIDHRPSTAELKQISEQFNRSLAGARFDSQEALFAGLASIGMKLTAAEQTEVAAATYTGRTWTAENFRRMVSIPSTSLSLLNTIIYVACTLTLFNIGFAMVLAITTFYMPEQTAGFFRGLWLLPRISPPVLYVLLWKWLAWDTGFLSAFLAPFGVAQRNWLLDPVSMPGSSLSSSTDSSARRWEC
jgi:inositol-phosphate transport system permease protein